VVVISVSIPDALLKEIDKLVEDGLYSNRSEAVRFSLEDSVSGYELDPETWVECVIAIIYNREDTKIENKLAAVRHDFDHILIETLHRHLERSCGCGEVRAHYCFELLIAEGRVAEVTTLIRKVRSIRGIGKVSHGLVPIAAPIHESQGK